jgi:hypothetical protein
MTQYLTNIDTQDFVYKYLKNPDILYEFLFRAYTNKLGNDIKTDIESNNQFSDYEKIIIKSVVKKSPGDIFILIGFLIKETETETESETKKCIGHASFHLLKNSINTDDGPMHIGNDCSKSKYRRRRFRIEKRIETTNIYRGLKFSIGGRAVPGYDMNFPLNEISNSVINVLNLYFDPTNPFSLTIKSDQTSTKIPKLEEYVSEILTHNFPPRCGGSRKILKPIKNKKNATRRNYNKLYT